MELELFNYIYRCNKTGSKNILYVIKVNLSLKINVYITFTLEEKRSHQYQLIFKNFLICIVQDTEEP
jgi:hypothetical protein